MHPFPELPPDGWKPPRFAKRAAGIVGILGVACLLAFFMFEAEAKAAAGQSASGYGHKERGYEGKGVDYSELYSRRESSLRIKRAVDELPHEAAKTLPLPILFGVARGDLAPNFGDARDGGSRSHEGLDILATEGTPVISPTDAVVLRVSKGGNAGTYVSTANPGGETFVYMHLKEAADLEAGEKIKAGALIGLVGNTGNAFGGPAHLHFEIRKGGKAHDPLERITEELSLQQKLSYLEAILNAYDDALKLAVFLADTYPELFVEAGTEGIKVPALVAAALPEKVQALDIGGNHRDLTLGSKGDDVRALQSVLISEGHLRLSAPTGYFGPATQAALVRYQQTAGIAPALGYFGPLTRAHMSEEGRRVAVVAPANVSGELSLADLIRLFVSLDIIPKEKEEAAFDALRAFED